MTTKITLAASATEFTVQLFEGWWIFFSSELQGKESYDTTPGCPLAPLVFVCALFTLSRSFPLIDIQEMTCHPVSVPSIHPFGFGTWMGLKWNWSGKRRRTQWHPKAFLPFGTWVGLEWDLSGTQVGYGDGTNDTVYSLLALGNLTGTRLGLEWDWSVKRRQTQWHPI